MAKTALPGTSFHHRHHHDFDTLSPVPCSHVLSINFS